MKEKIMKIELIKQKFNGCCSYKYKPFQHCCNRMQDNPCIELVDELCEGSNDVLPVFALCNTETFTSYEDEFEQNTYFKINFCPFCGEPIEIFVVNEEDVDDYYKSLSKQREELWKKYNKTDSKKKAQELYEQVHELDSLIDWLYQLAEYENVKEK